MEQLKAIVYCRGNTQKELNLQYEKLRTFAERNGYRIVRTISEFGDLDDMTWRTLRLFQVVDRIGIFRDRVEISVNIKLDMFKNGISKKTTANPTGEYSVVGGVNSVSLSG